MPRMFPRQVAVLSVVSGPEVRGSSLVHTVVRNQTHRGSGVKSNGGKVSACVSCSTPYIVGVYPYGYSLPRALTRTLRAALWVPYGTSDRPALIYPDEKEGYESISFGSKIFYGYSF